MSAIRTWKLYITVLLGWLLLFGTDLNACVPQVNLGGFIAFCQGNSLTLNAQNPNCTYSWSTGATTPQITVTTSGTYWVTVTNVCGTARDTVVVQVDQALQINLGADRAICSTGDTLRAPFISGASYNWSGGGTPYGNKLFVNQAGSYSVQVTNACGTFSDQVNISTKAPVSLNLGPDQFICNNSPYTITLPDSLLHYKWFKIGNSTPLRSGPQARSYSFSNSGVYWVEVTTVCGVLRDTIDIWFSEGPGLQLPNPITVCGGGSAQIQANATRGTYLWSTGASTRSITVNTPGTYWVRFTDACGTFYDTTSVVIGGPAVVNLGPDRTLCLNKPFALDAGNPGSSYLWSTSQTSKAIIVRNPGTYWVRVNNGCGPRYDTVVVTAAPTPVDPIGDTVYYCRGSWLPVDLGNWGPNSGYLWNDGNRSQSRNLSVEGYYTAQVWNECDTIDIGFHFIAVDPLNIDLGRDTVLCGGSITLNPGIDKGPNDISWSNGSIDTSIVASRSGRHEYWVRAQNACGVYTDTIVVTILNKPQGFPVDSLVVCGSNPSHRIAVLFDSTFSYLWNTGGTQNFINATSPGMYWVTIFSPCDTVTDSIKLVYQYPIQLDLGPDTTLCAPGLVYYNLAPLDPDSVRWSTGSRNAGLPIQSSGTYWVKAWNACGLYTDTVRVTINSKPQRKLPRRVKICSGQSYTLNAAQGANAPGTTFQWSTSATTPSITVSQAGWYKVVMSNPCGTVRDSTFIEVHQNLSSFSLGRDTIFCAGTLTLDPGYFPTAQYEWQDGSQDTSYTVTQSGTYYLKLSNACNAVYDTIEVLITGPPVLVLGSETRYCYGSFLTLNAQNPGSSYLWSTGATTQTLQVDSAGIYWVTISNPCGTLTDTVNVVVEYNLKDVDLGPDTSICRGQSLTLRTQYPDVAHLWSDGSRDTSLTVNQTGIYYVRIQNTCGVWNDSVYVEVIDTPLFSLGPDRVICAVGGSLDLKGPPGMLSYSWNGGQGPDRQNWRISAGGTYYLTVSNKCFSYTDTVFVEEEFPIEIDLGEDTVLCETNTLLLQSGVTDYPVKWNTGQVKPNLSVSESGWYWAMAENSCGLFIDSIYVRFQPVLYPPDFDTTICLDDVARIDLRNFPYPIEWEDGSSTRLRYVDREDTLLLKITNTCGEFEKRFIVQKVNCDCPIYVPDAFTPNGDGINDAFFVKHNCPLLSYRIQIYNRWGKRVFESDDIEEVWDGRFNGGYLEQGVYNYQIQYKYEVYELPQKGTLVGQIKLLK